MAAIRSTGFDEARSCLWIDLLGGSTLVDSGAWIALRGPLTWQAALETAAAAERHGWTEVTASGDQKYKDAVTVACLLRGITVTNHTLSAKAQAELHRLIAERAAATERRVILEPSRNPASGYESRFRSLTSDEIHRRITKHNFAPNASETTDPGTDGMAFVLKPRVASRREKKHPPDRLRERG